MPYPTGTVQVELREGIPTYTIHERVAWDHISPTSDAIDLAEKADAICFGTLAQRSRQSRETIQAISSFAPKDAYRLLDINLRQRYYDEEFNVLRDLFGLNGTEREVALWFIEKYGLRMFVLTAGSSHSTIYTREEISTLPTPEVTVADTVGAGDAFSGALIISLLKGKSLSEAHHFAVKTAAFVCTKEGAWPVYEE